MDNKHQIELDQAQEILRLIAAGFSNRDIAALLQVDVETVTTQKVAAMQKLRLRGRLDVIRYAEQQGWAW